MRKLHLVLPCLLGISFGLGSQTAFADDAKVLPKNRWRIQMMSSFSFADERWDSSGSSVSIGDSYSLSLTPSFVSMLKPQVQALSAALNTVQPGLSETMRVTDIGVDIRSAINANAVAAEYGITDRLSVGVIVPVIYGNVEVKAKSSETPEYQGFIQKLPEQHPLRQGLQAMQAQLSVDGINQTLKSSMGYDSGMTSWSGAGLGDIEIGAKYKYLDALPLRMTVKAGVRLPTGRRDNPDLLFDLGFGDGQFDLAAYHYIDYQPTSNVYFTLENGYTAQLPNRATFRVPVVNGVEVTPVRAKLDRNLGDIVETAVEANWSFTRLLTISPKYRYKHKFQDGFSGGGNVIDTKILESETADNLHEGTLTFGYSNLPRVRSGKSKIPFDAQVFYKHRFAGENVSQAETGGVQLKAYF